MFDVSHDSCRNVSCVVVPVDNPNPFWNMSSALLLASSTVSMPNVGTPGPATCMLGMLCLRRSAFSAPLLRRLLREVLHYRSAAVCRRAFFSWVLADNRLFVSGSLQCEFEATFTMTKFPSASTRAGSSKTNLSGVEDLNNIWPVSSGNL